MCAQKRLSNTNADKHLVVLVMVVQLLATKLLRGNAMQEGSGGKHVSISLNRNTGFGKDFCKELAGRQRGQAPVFPPMLHIVLRYLAGSVRRHQQSTAGLENAVKRLSGRAQIIYKLQGLGQNNAIESIRRYLRSIRSGRQQSSLSDYHSYNEARRIG